MELKIKPEIQKLFYEDVLKRYEEKCKFWNEDDIPECEVKNQKLIESLPKCLKWLKEEYILNNRGINETTTAFFSKYFNDTSDKASKQNINKQFKKIGLIPQKKRTGTNTNYYYQMKAEELYNAFDKNKWIDKEVDFINNDDRFEEVLEGFQDEEDDKDKEDYSLEELQQQMENIQAKINKKLENKICNINIKDKTNDNKKVIKEYLNIESTEKKKKKKKKKKKEKKVQEDKIITQYDISKKCNEGSEKMDLIFDWNE